MTVREKLYRQKKKALKILYTGFAIIIAGSVIAWGIELKEFEPIIYVGIGVFIIGIFFQNGIKCPVCDKNLAQLVMVSSDKIQSCPYCSTNLDERIES